MREETGTYDDATVMHAGTSVKYDLVGKLVEETSLTRRDVVRILTGIEETVFNQFKYNPEEFILRATKIINDEKAAIVIEQITYDKMDERYDTDIFTESMIQGKLGVNAIKAKRHLYDHVVYDSTNEKNFVEKLDVDNKVAVYVKLPKGFYISTPVGKYNPDWAIAFNEGEVKHIYFIAETKGSLDSLNFGHISPTEKAKIKCSREHFKTISGDNVVYEVVDSYTKLMEMVRK